MTLVLDPDIRDWVVLPLFVIIVVTGLLRHEVSLYINAQTKKVPQPLHVSRVQSMLQYCSYLRNVKAMSHFVTSSTQWNQKKHGMIQLLQKEIQYLQAEEVKQKEDEARGEAGGANASSSSSNDPMEMMMKNPLGMLGGNMIFMVQNMVMMQGIQHFFSGFILLQVPFSLTIGFKSMFQKGVVDLPNLSSSYVSSVSWYFLVLYGLRSLFKLLIGQPSFEQREQEMWVQQQMGYQNPPNPTGPKQDLPSLIKLLNNEVDQLELFTVPTTAKTTEFESVEQRLLGPQRYPKRVNAAMNPNHSSGTNELSNTDLLFSISQSKKVAVSTTKATASDAGVIHTKKIQ
jgi:ER membrane protein complex subunit 3